MQRIPMYALRYSDRCSCSMAVYRPYYGVTALSQHTHCCCCTMWHGLLGASDPIDDPAELARDNLTDLNLDLLIPVA